MWFAYIGRGKGKWPSTTYLKKYAINEWFTQEINVKSNAAITVAHKNRSLSHCSNEIRHAQVQLTHSVWTARERRCYAMMIDDDRRPCRLNVRNLCRAPDRLDVANDAIPTNVLPPTSWPAQLVPAKRKETEKKNVNLIRQTFSHK